MMMMIKARPDASVHVLVPYLPGIFALRGGGNWHTKQNVAFYGLLRGAAYRRGGVEGVPDLITIGYVGGLY